MLAVAKKKAAEQKTKIEWMQGNAMALPFADNTFDVVTIGFGLRNVPDLVTVLKRNAAGRKTWRKSGLSGNITAHFNWLAAAVLCVFPIHYAAVRKTVC